MFRFARVAAASIPMLAAVGGLTGCVAESDEWLPGGWSRSGCDGEITLLDVVSLDDAREAGWLEPVVVEETVAGVLGSRVSRVSWGSGQPQWRLGLLSAITGEPVDYELLSRSSDERLSYLAVRPAEPAMLVDHTPLDRRLPSLIEVDRSGTARVVHFLDALEGPLRELEVTQFTRDGLGNAFVGVTSGTFELQGVHHELSGLNAAILGGGFPPWILHLVRGEGELELEALHPLPDGGVIARVAYDGSVTVGDELHRPDESIPAATTTLLLRIDPASRIVWSAQVAGDVERIVLGPRELYVPTRNHYLLRPLLSCLERSTGELRWSHEHIPSAGIVQHPEGLLLIGDGDPCAVDHGGPTAALLDASGRFRWLVSQPDPEIGPSWVESLHVLPDGTAVTILRAPAPSLRLREFVPDGTPLVGHLRL